MIQRVPSNRIDTIPSQAEIDAGRRSIQAAWTRQQRQRRSAMAGKLRDRRFHAHMRFVQFLLDTASEQRDR